jgi:DNA-binding Xre family transcriptional regulator
MARDMKDIIWDLPAGEQRAIENLAAEMVAEELTLRELRRARKITQTKIAKKLKLTQDNISRLEKRSNVLLSTLQKTIAAMGGDLSLIATFPDRKPVRLAGFSNEPGTPKRARAKAPSATTPGSRYR